MPIISTKGSRRYLESKRNQRGKQPKEKIFEGSYVIATLKNGNK